MKELVLEKSGPRYTYLIYKPSVIAIAHSFATYVYVSQGLAYDLLQRDVFPGQVVWQALVDPVPVDEAGVRHHAAHGVVVQVFGLTYEKKGKIILKAVAR